MLVCKNVIVNGRRTSMRLDRETWISLADICQREGMTIHQLCSKIDLAKGNSGLSSATRLFVLTYFRFVLNQYEHAGEKNDALFNPNLILQNAG